MHPKLLGVLTIPALCLFAVAQETPTSRPSSQPSSTEISAAETEWRAVLQSSVALLNDRKMSEGVDAARRALTIASENFGAGGEKTIQSQLHLSSMLMLIGDLDGAEELAITAHEASKQILAKAQSRVATTLKYLGNFYMQRGKMNESQQAFEEAVEVSTRALGAEDPETAKHIGNLAAIHLRKKEWDRARELLEEAMAIWNAQPEPNPVYTVTSMTNLAALYMETGDSQLALELYEEGMKIQLDAFGAESPRRLNLLRNYAQILDQLEEGERAAEIRAEISSIEGK